MSHTPVRLLLGRWTLRDILITVSPALCGSVELFCHLYSLIAHSVAETRMVLRLGVCEKSFLGAGTCAVTTLEEYEDEVTSVTGYGRTRSYGRSDKRTGYGLREVTASHNDRKRI